MENKITVSQKFTEIIAMCEGQTLSDGTTVEDFLNDRIEKCKRKGGSSKKSASPEYIALCDRVVEVLGSATEPMKAGDFLKFEGLTPADGVSVQKVSAILKTLVGEGKVVNDKDKKSSVFSLAQ